MNARQLRLIRAASVSVVATLVAALSHTTGGGATPHPLLILAVAALLTPLSALLVGIRTSRGRVAAAVFLAQGSFHLLFQALGSPTEAGTGTAEGLGHSHHIELALLAPVSSAASPGAAMLFAHVSAAALTTLLVWHGEAVVRTVARWVQALLRHAAAVATVEHRRPPRLRTLVMPSFNAAISTTVPRRGPPPLGRD